MAHPNDHVHSSVHTYSNINESLLKALTETVRPFDRIVVSDISWQAPDPLLNLQGEYKRLIEEKLPEAIREFKERGGELVLLDHHPGALATKAYYSRFLHQESIVETKDHLGAARAGSELAARYFRNRREFQCSPAELEAVTEFGRITGVYDTWRTADPDWEVACQMAMAQSELLDDPQTCMADMLYIIHCMTQCPDYHRGRKWDLLLKGGFEPTVFGTYYMKAPARFEEMVAEARRTSIKHGEFITEIYCTHFESLIAECIYQETGGVVAIRFTKERHMARKLSFRRSQTSAVPIQLGNLLKQLAERGGGHDMSAGITLDPGQTIDYIIDQVARACEGIMTPGAA